MSFRHNCSAKQDDWKRYALQRAVAKAEHGYRHGRNDAVQPALVYCSNQYVNQIEIRFARGGVWLERRLAGIEAGRSAETKRAAAHRSGRSSAVRRLCDTGMAVTA
jgi:hypothetical protein